MSTTAYVAGLAAAVILGVAGHWLLAQVTAHRRPKTPSDATGDTLREACDRIDQLAELVAEANTYEAYGPWPRNTRVLDLLCQVKDWRRSNGPAGGAS